MSSSNYFQPEAIFQNVLVLATCAPHLDAALWHACHWAAQSGAVLHVAHRDWVAAGDQQPRRDVMDLVVDWNSAAVHLRSLEVAPALHRVLHRIHISPFGRSMNLADLLRRERIDLLVLSHRADEPSPAGSGSTSSLVGAARCPVLLIGPGAAAPEDRTPVGRVLCGSDFSLAGNEALAYACQLASRSGGRLMAAHVVEPRKDSNPMRLADAEVGLRELVTGAVRSGLRAELVVEPGEPATVISNLAYERHADLVVVGFAADQQPASMHGRVTLWSLVASVPCPVLVIPENRFGRSLRAAA